MTITPTVYTPTATWATSYTMPTDGLDASAASANVPTEGALDRTQWLHGNLAKYVLYDSREGTTDTDGHTVEDECTMPSFGGNLVLLSSLIGAMTTLTINPALFTEVLRIQIVAHCSVSTVSTAAKVLHSVRLEYTTGHGGTWVPVPGVIARYRSVAAPDDWTCVLQGNLPTIGMGGTSIDFAIRQSIDCLSGSGTPKGDLLDTIAARIEQYREPA